MSINRLAPHWPRGVPRSDARGRVAKRSKSAARRSSQSIAAGSELGPENPPKVETRVQIPLGLRRQNRRSRPKFWPTFATNEMPPPRLIPQISRSRSGLAVCAVGPVMPDRTRRFSSHPVIGRRTPSGSRVSTCLVWIQVTSFTRSDLAIESRGGERQRHASSRGRGDRLQAAFVEPHVASVLHEPFGSDLDSFQHPPFHREVAELHKDQVEQGQPRSLPSVVLLHAGTEPRFSGR